MSIIPRFFMEATVVLGRLPISNPRWCATGFVDGRYEGTQDGNEKFSTYLITNRHVVENEEKMVMQVNLQNGVKAYLLSLASENSTPNYSTHPAADVIACHININPALSEGAQLPFFDLRHHTLTLQQMSDTGVCEGGLIRRHLRQIFEFVHDGIHHILEWLFEISILLFTIMGGQTAISNTYTNDEMVKLYPWLPLYFKTYPNTQPQYQLSFPDGRPIPSKQIDDVLCKWAYKCLIYNMDISAAIAATNQELTELLT